MYETPEDLATLQTLLDTSAAAAGRHLRSIFRDDLRPSAADLAAELPGVFVLHLATTTAAGHPFVAPIDGLFYRGRIFFSIPPGGLRARHLRARPHVSATVTRGEDFCVIVHGTAAELDAAHPLWAGYSEYEREVYGAAAIEASDAVYADREEPGLTAWIEPRRLFALLRPPAAG